MQSFLGPVALDQIEATIGIFDEVLLATSGRRVVSLRAENAIGFAWACGCEARGNGSPFCLWRPCRMHETLAAGMPPGNVPLGYESGERVLRESVPRPALGHVLIPADAAIAESRAAGAPVGYVEGGRLIREYPDGRREVVSSA
ncbi:MAG: hypothetical protein QOJ39_313 [Candidatus Eremiobacteraeota bacterium]|jgi:hypothetical protein|nr:hypothetical protein [Candidatus Eremiobacteraeota bacterium]MEA2718449.1 hypothetical protein [Candidatus Eremiobacteraeota bacterium]